jgi:hypothetical protein
MLKKAVDLTGVRNAMGTKDVIDHTLMLSLTGFFVLAIGTVMAFSLKNPPEVFLGLWISISGFVTIAYSLIKLFKNILIY